MGRLEVHPQDRFEDWTGKTPKPGDYVAFNLSGNLAAGYVKKVAEGIRYKKYRHPVYHVECVVGPSYSIGRVSKVVNGKNLLVLEEASD